MSYTYNDFIVAQQLSQLARVVPVPINYLWPTLFPQVSINSNTFEYQQEIDRIIMAEFMAPDSDTVPIPRQDIVFSEGSLAAVGAHRSLRSEQIWEAALAGRLASVETKDVQDLANSINANKEYCALQTLFEGQIVMDNGYGVRYTLDYGTHGVDTTPAINWNLPATAVPIDDIIAWSDLIETATGYRPAAFVTSRKQVRNILNAQSVRDSIWNWANSQGPVTLTQFNQLLSSKFQEGPIIQYDTTIQRVDHQDHGLDSVRTTDEDVFIGLPPAEVSSSPGLTVSGVTPEAAVAYAEVRQQLDAVAEGVWVETFTERVPSVQRKVRAKSAYIPIFPHIEKTMRATVQ